jgi:hypothetical protein
MDRNPRGQKRDDAAIRECNNSGEIAKLGTEMDCSRKKVVDHGI